VKQKTSWYSNRVGTDVTVARWGEIGAPLLIFPTAGGDAEEIERFLVIEALSPFLAAGRIKVYSCDSVAGRAMLVGEGSPQHRMYLLNQFHEFVYREVVPLIRTDCHVPDIGIVAAGASIGAFNALAMLCRFPDAFTHAVCMSGTYDLRRFVEGEPTEDFYFASPLHFLPDLEGPALEKLQSRFALIPSGEGRDEDIGESWRLADVLGGKGVPNRVDSWGPDWHHDWPTWRNMLVRYVEELVPPNPD
jgi:esterase/lipase superfamily enzyme